MKRLLALLPLLLLAACTGQSGESEFQSLWVVLDGTHWVADGTVFNGAIIVLGGEVEVGERAEVNGDVLMITGKITVGGMLSGNLYAIGGDVVLEATAVVRGNLNVGGGQFERAPEARVSGAINIGNAPELPAVFVLTGSPLLDRVLKFLIETLPLMLLAALLARFMPKSLHRMERTVKQYTLVAGATGLLVLLVGLSLLVLMAFTIVLLPVALAGVVALFVTIGYGWVAIGLITGRKLAQALPGQPGLVVLAVLGMLVFRLVLSLLEPIPVVGTVTVVLTASLGTGAAFITRFGRRVYSPPAPDMW